MLWQQTKLVILQNLNIFHYFPFLSFDVKYKDQMSFLFLNQSFLIILNTLGPKMFGMGGLFMK